MPHDKGITRRALRGLAKLKKGSEFLTKDVKPPEGRSGLLTRLCRYGLIEQRREEIMDGENKITWRRYKAPVGYRWKDTALPIKALRAQLKREARKLTRWAEDRQTGRKLRLVSRESVINSGTGT